MIRFIYTILITLLFLGNIYTAKSQNTISGTIEDNNHNPLAGANISIKNTTLGTASGPHGNYLLGKLKEGNYIVRVSFFGYESIERPVTISGKNSKENFILNKTTIDLNAVVVTGTRTEKTLKNTPVLTQIINSKELQNSGVTDISQALEFAVSGLEFKNQAQGKSVSLQGLDPQYLVFMTDGERMAGETMGDIDYSRINVENIERIEVVKGASSTLYGSNALGGVVNIISKTPSKKFEMDASTRFSNFNTQSHRARIGNKLGDFSSQLSVSYDQTDGYDLLAGNSYRTQEREDAVTITERLKYALTNKIGIEANASFLNKNRDNSSEKLYNRRNKDLTYGAKASYFFGKENSIVMSWNSDHYELLNKITETNLESDYDNLFNNARLLGHFKMANWNLLTTGIEYISENLTAQRNNIKNKTNSDFVFFAQEDIQIFDNLNFIAGIRANNNSNYNWHFTPQFSALYKTGEFSLRGTYSLGYKTPSLKEKYMNFRIPAPGPPMFLVGKEDLKPETSNYISASAEYNHRRISVSTTVYKNNIENMISPDIDTFIVKPGGIIEYSYNNLRDVTIRGADIMLKVGILTNLSLSAAATFSKKTDNLTGKEFENVRNFTSKGNIDYSYKKSNYQLNANVQANFYGAKTINLMDEQTHHIQKVNLDNFSLWRITTTQTLKNSYYLKLGIDNVFDFVDSSGGYNSGTPGRTFFVGLGVKI